jgi:hypothetical protein
MRVISALLVLIAIASATTIADGPNYGSLRLDRKLLTFAGDCYSLQSGLGFYSLVFGPLGGLFFCRSVLVRSVSP